MNLFLLQSYPALILGVFASMLIVMPSYLMLLITYKEQFTL